MKNSIQCVWTGFFLQIILTKCPPLRLTNSSQSQKVKIPGHKVFSTGTVILKICFHSDIVKETSDISEDLQYLRTQKTNSRMEGKGENKGTKRRPKTRMEQPEETWAREKLVSVSLKSSSEILQGLSSFLLLFLQKSTQTRQ